MFCVQCTAFTVALLAVSANIIFSVSLFELRSQVINHYCHVSYRALRYALLQLSDDCIVNS